MQPATAIDNKALDRFLSASFGIFSGSAIAWAVLRFSPQASRWVADETWHSEQIGQWIGDSYELQIPYSDPRELMMDVLKYGPDVEVLSPPELREMVAGRLQLASLQYRVASANSK